MNSNKSRLMRKTTEAEESSLRCSRGYIPRKGKAARRERDCTVDCEDYAACEAKAKQAYWVEKK